MPYQERQMATAPGFDYDEEEDVPETDRSPAAPDGNRTFIVMLMLGIVFAGMIATGLAVLHAA